MGIVRFKSFWLLLMIAIAVFKINAQTFSNNFIWKEKAALPPGKGGSLQKGLASPFAGTFSDGTILVAGGCNFPGKPVIDGGEKVFHKDIYVLTKDSEWKVVSQMASGLAYGASVSIPEGVLCIGGNNSENISKEVFLLTWNKEKNMLDKIQYPDLPIPLTSCSATLCEGIIYLGGSKTINGTGNYFMSLDLKKKNDKSFGWKILPDFPGDLRINPILVTQNGKESANIYLFGGFTPSTDKTNAKVTNKGLIYNPKTQVWEETSEVRVNNSDIYALQGASAIAVGSNHILFIGGVNKNIFENAVHQEYIGSKAKTQAEKEVFEKWKYDYYNHSPEWYNFNNKVLVYHTITDIWTIEDVYPFPAPAGAAIVPYNSGWLIINGEICPGIRSNKVYYGAIDNKPVFGGWNWTVLTIYLVSMLLLGYYFVCKSQNTDDYFKGGGRLPWWAAGISIFATMLSAITFMAIPAKAYATDWRYFPMAITILIMAWPVLHYYLPFFRRLNILTAYEYLEYRFNNVVRLVASTLFIIFMLSRMALALFLPSLALTTVTGIDIYMCILLMGIVTLVYCTMGGAEAVVWSDVIQGIVLLGGALLTVVFLVVSIPGGFSEVIDIAITDEKLRLFDFSWSFESATFWVIILGGLANNLITYTSDQAVIQRYISTKTEKSAGNSILLNGFLSVLVSVIFYFIGTGLYVFYKTYPEKIDCGMQNMDAIYPHYIMAELPVGLAGLLIAAIFAATMSTISANMNSIATAFTVDFYRKFCNNSSEKKQLSVARWASIISGSIGIVLALLMAGMNILSLFDFFNYLLGILSSGVAALFIIGIFMPRVGTVAAVCGFFTGNIILLLICKYTSVSFLIYGFIGIMLTLLLSLIFSLFIPNRQTVNGYTWNTLQKRKD